MHNLKNPAPFTECDLILIRNVMIYFNKELQNRVHKLFMESLCRLGFLVMGQKESLKFCPSEKHYLEFDANARIYQKRSG